jgi:hypothetical protein
MRMGSGIQGDDSIYDALAQGRFRAFVIRWHENTRPLLIRRENELQLEGPSSELRGDRHSQA